MDDIQLNADRTKIALVQGARLPWIASPEIGVDRRMLERSGGEVAIASSIVRYRPGSRFHAHAHGRGEEFLVLEGVFSDEHGDYPVGTYVRNPSGSTHAPHSTEGCVIFVKLRQMHDDEPEQLRTLPADHHWRTATSNGHEQAPLYSNGRISVTLDRLRPGSRIDSQIIRGGREIFVVRGSVTVALEESTTLDPWSWLRHPGEIHPSVTSEEGALLWIKRGHLL